MTQKDKKKNQEIREYFHSQIQGEISRRNTERSNVVADGGKLKRGPITYLIENNLWDVDSLIRSFSDIQNSASGHPPRVRKLIKDICVIAYALTHTHFNPQLNALKNKRNV